MNLKTAARRLGVHYQTAYRWVRSGQLVAVKVGSGYEISEAALNRFQVQRAALERVPVLDDVVELNGSAATRPIDRDEAVATLDAMLERVTVEARPIAHRATRLVADILGDAAILYGLDEDGQCAVLHVAHHDPVCEVTTATVARHGDPNGHFARGAVSTLEPLFIQQVPQRNLRQRLRAEVQQHLVVTGCYSVISVPVVVDGNPIAALVASRDTPVQPYTREDLEFVSSVARRLECAYTLAARCRRAWDLRERVVGALQQADAGMGEVALLDVTGSHDAVAVLDLELRYIAATDTYAALVGSVRTSLLGTALLGRALAPHATDADDACEPLSRLLCGELDFCEVPLPPASTSGTPVLLHAAMVREPDATPRCIVVVAQPMPAARVATSSTGA